MTSKRTTKRRPTTKYEPPRPLLVLLNTKHPDDCYGWERIDVLGWNIDGSGWTLCRVYSELDSEPELQLFSVDMPTILTGDGHGNRLYVEAPPDWDGRTLPKVEHPHESVDYETYHWGTPVPDPTSDAALFWASSDRKAELLAERRRNARPAKRGSRKR